MSTIVKKVLYGAAGASCAILGHALVTMVKSKDSKPEEKLVKSQETHISQLRGLQEDQEIEELVGNDLIQAGVDSRKDPDIWNHVLFFPDPFVIDFPESRTSQFLWFFKQAKISIHLCIFYLNFTELERIVVQKHLEGVKIRIITAHPSTPQSRGLPQFAKHGIKIRAKAFGGEMHHKFAIIDSEAIVTGSLNWTKQGLEKNKENVLVTTKHDIVTRYVQEFRKIWADFDDLTLADYEPNQLGGDRFSTAMYKMQKF